MKHIITLLLLLVTFTVAAQSYSPCYTEFMAKGNAAYNQGKYNEAKTYYAKAKQCAGGNPTEAQKKIGECEAELDLNIISEKEEAFDGPQSKNPSTRVLCFLNYNSPKLRTQKAKQLLTTLISDFIWNQTL